MDRRNFLKLFGAASTIPVVVTAEKALGEVEIIKPFIREESESKIVLANHLPPDLGKLPIIHIRDNILSYNLRGEDNGVMVREIGYRSSRWAVGLLEYHLEFEAYIVKDSKDDINKLVYMDVSTPLYIWLDIRPGEISHPIPINKQMKMVMVEKEITAEMNNLMTARFIFKEIR